MIIHGDAIDNLKEIETDSIDFICTDPPYGYSFMGKDWDKAVPSVELWQECLRVLKPGAFITVMSAPRSDVQMHMIKNISEAGFRVDFTPIYWTYASGFPKAGNIGKLVDKRNGVQGEVIGTGKAGAGMNKVKGFGTTTTKGGEATTEWDVRKVVSELDGSYAGFQPKPAVEVIIVAMKPLSEKTYVDQALSNGKGISWLDDCRIPTDQPLEVGSSGRGGTSTFIAKEVTDQPREYQTQGRFPANLLVSDDVLNTGEQSKSKARTTPSDSINKGYYGGGIKSAENEYSDSGSYSRYFDLDKWASTLPFLITPKASKSEKNKGLEHTNLESKIVSGESNAGGVMGINTPENRAGRGVTGELPAYKNHHPTVKPLKLMSYLITLFSRPGDTILDPFCGSGTTCIAAKELGREYIGIDREPEYVEIAKARLEALKEPEPKLL